METAAIWTPTWVQKQQLTALVSTKLKLYQKLTSIPSFCDSSPDYDEIHIRLMLQSPSEYAPPDYFADSAICYDNLLRYYVSTGKYGEKLTVFLANPRRRRILNALAMRYHLNSVTAPIHESELKYVSYYCFGLCNGGATCGCEECWSISKPVTKVPTVISNPENRTRTDLKQVKSLAEIFEKKPRKCKESKNKGRCESSHRAVAGRYDEPLPSLPHGCVSEIFSFLTFDDAVNGNRASKHFHAALDSSVSLWKGYYEKHFKDSERVMITPQENENSSARFWKRKCRNTMGFCRSTEAPCRWAPRHAHTHTHN